MGYAPGPFFFNVSMGDDSRSWVPPEMSRDIVDKDVARPVDLL